MSKAPVASLIIALSIVFCCSVVPAKADFEISVGSGTIDPDGNLSLEISIASDAPPQGMSDYELILEITPLTMAPGSSLIFVEPQSEQFLADADYIFAASSEVIADGVSAVTSNTGDEITFIDVSSDVFGDFLDVPVTSGHLLATVDFKHVLGTATASETAGDQYSITVSELSGFFQADGTFVDFTSTAGTVSVAAVAIPEPSSIAMLSLASCGILTRRRRRRRA